MSLSNNIYQFDKLLGKGAKMSTISFHIEKDTKGINFNEVVL